jgi:integrase
MPSVANRSRWAVTFNGEEKTFKSKKEAQAFFDTLPSGKKNIKQLETTFEAQIKLKDREGNIIKQTASYSSYKEAWDWAVNEESRILNYKKEHGNFNVNFETMTLEDALKQTLEEHYKGRPSYKENSYRVPHIVERMGGPYVLLKDVKQAKLIQFRKKLQAEGYAPATIRNEFSILSRMFTLAQKEWLFPVDNEAKKVQLEKPDNAIERNWESDEERLRFYRSVQLHRPWLMPIAEMSLEMTFRLGELVKKTLKVTDKEFGGLKWEGVDFENEVVRIEREKNDWKKKAGERKGREVPMTRRMKEILLDLYGDRNLKRTGPVFNTTASSVSKALNYCLEHADPPIKNFTFHSLRKIATYRLSKDIDNPMMLARLSSHKDIKTLNDRYYKVPIEDLKALVNQIDEQDILKKGLILLEKKLGPSGLKEFLLRVRELGVDDKEEANKQAEAILKSEPVVQQVKFTPLSLKDMLNLDIIEVGRSVLANPSKRAFNHYIYSMERELSMIADDSAKKKEYSIITGKKEVLYGLSKILMLDNNNTPTRKFAQRIERFFSQYDERQLRVSINPSTADQDDILMLESEKIVAQLIKEKYPEVA